MLKKQYETPKFFSETVRDILCSSYDFPIGGLYGEEPSEDDKSEYD